MSDRTATAPPPHRDGLVLPNRLRSLRPAFADQRGASRPASLGHRPAVLIPRAVGGPTRGPPARAVPGVPPSARRAVCRPARTPFTFLVAIYKWLLDTCK